MFLNERLKGLLRSPLLLWRLLASGRYDFVYDRMPVSLRGMPWPKRLNLLKAGLNLAGRSTRPWSFPLHMQFELTNFCQLRCPLCPTGTRQLQRPVGVLDPVLFKHVFAEVGPYLLTASLWGWGEPLLHPRLGEILAATARYPVVTFLSTNGQCLNRDCVVRAICTYPPSFLIVALDGLDEETLNSYRRGARLSPALEGIRRIAEFKRATGSPRPILHLRFIVTRHNQEQVSRLRDFALACGFDMFSLRELSLVSIPTAAALTRHFRSPTSRRPPVARRYLCMQPFWFPSMFADGTITICQEDYNAAASLGRIGPGTSFASLWYSPQASALRRKILHHRQAFPFCSPCPVEERGRTDTSFHAEFLSPAAAEYVAVHS